MIHVNYMNTIKLLKEAYHIVREESAKILAFIAADSTRVPEPGIPCHIPIAYGFKGYSLPMTIMRHLINDVRDHFKVAIVSIHCEVYDGQFLNLVRYSADDWSEMDVNDLVNKFLKHPKECMKMVVDELNLIGNLIQTYTGIKVFNVSDNKTLKINKLMANLQTSS